jgi:hypothetical protein
MKGWVSAVHRASSYGHFAVEKQKECWEWSLMLAPFSQPWTSFPAGARGATGHYGSFEEIELWFIDDAVVRLELGGRHVLARPGGGTTTLIEDKAS